MKGTSWNTQPDFDKAFIGDALWRAALRMALMRRGWERRRIFNTHSIYESNEWMARQCPGLGIIPAQGIAFETAIHDLYCEKGMDILIELADNLIPNDERNSDRTKGG